MQSTTGVRLLDTLLPYGVAPDLPLVIAGAMGTGRTVLSLELAAACVERGQPAVLLLAEPGEAALQQARSLGLELETPLRKDQLALLEMDPHAADLVHREGMTALADAILEELEAPDLIVIDPISALIPELCDERDVRMLLRDFLRRMQAPGRQIVFTFDTESLVGSRAIERMLSDLSGAYLELERKGTSHIVRAGKMRGPGGAAREIEFSVGKGGCQPLHPERIAPDGAPADEDDPDPRPGQATQNDRRRAGRRATDPPLSSLTGSPTATSATPSLTPSAVAPGSGAPQAAPTRQRLLLALARAEERAQLETWLRPTFEVECAADALSALSRACTRAPALLLLEPDLDDRPDERTSGYEVLRALRNAGVGTPVLVALDYNARMVDRVRPLVLGATDVIVKPFNSFELSHRIETLLQLPPQRPAADIASEAELLVQARSRCRSVSPETLLEHAGRAVQLGKRFGFDSTLLSLEVESEAGLENLTATVDHLLRVEDSYCVVTDRRALVLMICTQPQEARAIAERMHADLCAKGTGTHAKGAGRRSPRGGAGAKHGDATALGWAATSANELAARLLVQTGPAAEVDPPTEGPSVPALGASPELTEWIRTELEEDAWEPFFQALHWLRDPAKPTGARASSKPSR